MLSSLALDGLPCDCPLPALYRQSPSPAPLNLLPQYPLFIPRTAVILAYNVRCRKELTDHG